MNMKRSEFVLGALSVAFVGCTKDGIAEEAKNTKDKVEMKKPLVVYFSATGTTKGKAEILAKVLGADLKEIVPAERSTVCVEGDLRAAEKPDACGRVGHPHVGAGIGVTRVRPSGGLLRAD